MDIKVLFNFLKWQLKNRLPGGGFYERAFKCPKNIASESIEYYIYLCDLFRNPLLKYIFGSYLIDEKQLNEFYLFMDKNFAVNNTYYEFVLFDGTKLRIPIPEVGDRKIFRMELMDLILPYVAGYPKIGKLPFHEGPYEYGAVKLNQNDIVLDLGANFGMFSAFASSKGCQVYAFEPTKTTIQKYLSKTAFMNKGINVSEMAISNVDGLQEFTLDRVDSRCNGISETKTNLLKHEEDKIMLPVTTLDSFVKKENLKRVDFIKADIEGAERLMLEGAQYVLKEFEPDLAICYYHLLDDYSVLEDLIKKANPDYEITHNWKKIYARVRNKKK